MKKCLMILAAAGVAAAALSATGASAGPFWPHPHPHPFWPHPFHPGWHHPHFGGGAFIAGEILGAAEAAALAQQPPQPVCVLVQVPTPHQVCGTPVN